MYVSMNALFIHICMYLCICAYLCTYVCAFVDLCSQYLCMYVRMYEATMDVLLNRIFQHKLDYFLVPLKLSSMSRKYSKIAIHIDTSIALFRPLKLAH